MVIEARTHSLSRRQLFATGAMAALASFVRTSSASARQVQTDEIQPFRWALVQNKSLLARFVALESFEQRMQVPPRSLLDSTAAGSPIPGRRRPPSVLLRGSSNVNILNKWFQQVQTQGTLSAQKSLRLEAHDNEGKRLKHYWLQNSFPADLTMRGSDSSLTSTTVALCRLMCAAAGTLDDTTVVDDWLPPPGVRCALEIDGVEAASFQRLIGVAYAVEPDEQTKSDEGDSVTWSSEAGAARPLLLKFTTGRDYDNKIWSWHKNARAETIDTARNGATLVLYSAKGLVSGRYFLENAWPTDFDLSSRVTRYRHTLYRTLTVACDGLYPV